MKRLIICISLFLSSSLAHATSFDCAKASTTIEKTICADDQISALDSRLMETYKKALSETSNADDVKADQKTWLSKIRNKCPDAECIKHAYIDRIATLNSLSPKKEASEVEQPKPAIVTQNENATTSLPDISNSETTPKKIEEPAPQASAPISATQENGKPISTISNDKPSSPISDALIAISGLIGLILIAGMVKPKWVLRWNQKPTRLKVIAYVIPPLVIFSVLAPLSRTDARKEYETKIAEKSKQDNEQRKAQSASNKASTSTPAQSMQATSRSTKIQADQTPTDPSLRGYQRSAGNYLRISGVASKSPNNNPTNPACGSLIEDYNNKYSTETQSALTYAARMGDKDYIAGVYQTQAQILDTYSQQISMACGVN